MVFWFWSISVAVFRRLFCTDLTASIVAMVSDFFAWPRTAMRPETSSSMLSVPLPSASRTSKSPLRSDSSISSSSRSSWTLSRAMMASNSSRVTLNSVSVNISSRGSSSRFPPCQRLIRPLRPRLALKRSSAASRIADCAWASFLFFALAMENWRITIRSFLAMRKFSACLAAEIFWSLDLADCIVFSTKMAMMRLNIPIVTKREPMM
mmetsp:Transcript_112534/g.318365  ORF Transcript_112534/g.318365 Transcript_112534/m.318365 type:complete len:208 (-) Transcript_112534:1648-2271(-)